MPARGVKVLIGCVVGVFWLQLSTSQAQTSAAKSQHLSSQTNAAELAQMVDQLRQSPLDDALRERIIGHARKMRPAPQPSQEARRWFVRGNVAWADAHDKSDYAHAAALFEQAVSNAPWWSDAYAALAKAYEASENFDGAIRALKLFAVSTESEKDAREAEDRGYALEEKRDRQTKRQEAQRREAEARERAVAEQERKRKESDAVVRAVRERVEGATYSRWICYTRMIDMGNHQEADGCNKDEFEGKNWHDWGSGPLERFDFSEPGVIRIVFIRGFPEAHSINIVGTPNGPSVSDIRWQCPIIGWDGSKSRITGWQDAWARYQPDGSSIIFTCRTPRPYSNPTTKYPYSWYRRN